MHVFDLLILIIFHILSPFAELLVKIDRLVRLLGSRGIGVTQLGAAHTIPLLLCLAILTGTLLIHSNLALAKELPLTLTWDPIGNLITH